MREPNANPSGLIGKNVAYISLSKACLMVIKCLSLERDYNVLSLVLDDVPLVLQNKAVFVLYGHNIKDFVNPLIDLTENNNQVKYPDVLFNLPETDAVTGRKFGRGDFYNKVHSVLAAIVPYSDFLDGAQSSFTQTKITRFLVTTLLNGLAYKEASRYENVLILLKELNRETFVLQQCSKAFHSLQYSFARMNPEYFIALK